MSEYDWKFLVFSMAMAFVTGLAFPFLGLLHIC